ncbi:phosphodiester glycosidase family protein [Fontivita pretiosa]|uniref:phosphodiester glycosidase family protein n=1 Tax=Fontivita pretiosa TaxID=2989684 RepID=UPI003D16F316
MNCTSRIMLGLLTLLISPAARAQTTRPATMPVIGERISHPFPGVRYVHRTIGSPRLVDLHIVQIDLRTPGLRFSITEPNGADAPGETTAETTRQYLSRVGAQIAINASSDFADPAGQQYRNHYYVLVSGGQRVSPFKYGESAIHISRDNVATVVDQDPSDRAAGTHGYRCVPPIEPLYIAVGAKNRILADGINVGGVEYNGVDFRRNCSGHLPLPRTAVGVSRDGRKLILLVVDGRQPGHSLGMTTQELGQVMLELGASDAVNLDGGGSSTLVFADPNPRVLNRPSDGQERAVGANLAIFVGVPRGAER